MLVFEECTEALELRQRTGSVRRTGIAISETTQFHHGASAVGKWSKIQVDKPVRGAEFVGARGIGRPTEAQQQLPCSLGMPISPHG